MLKTSAYLEEKIPLMLAYIAAGDAHNGQLLAECVTDEARSLNPKFYPLSIRRQLT